MNPAELDWTRAGMITLAGPAQEKLDRQFGGGWKRHRDPVEEIAAHEIAHSIVAIILGKKIEHVTIVPVGTSLGHMRLVSKSQRTAAERIAELHTRPKISERRQAMLQFLEALREIRPKPDFRNARAAIREFIVCTESLLVQHRRCIDAIASELVQRRTMTRSEVEALAAHYGAHPLERQELEKFCRTTAAKAPAGSHFPHPCVLPTESQNGVIRSYGSAGFTS